MMFLILKNYPTLVNPMNISEITVDVKRDEDNGMPKSVEFIMILAGASISVKFTPRQIGEKEFIRLLQRLSDKKEARKMQERLADTWKTILSLDGLYDIEDFAKFVLFGGGQLPGIVKI